MRRFYAIWLVRELAVPVYSVSEWMRHGDVTLTLAMYVDAGISTSTPGVRALRAAGRRSQRLGRPAW